MASEKDHMSIVICGHVDSGKSTTTGRLLFELGGIPEREMEKLKAEADRLGKSSFAFAFYMDRQKEERERGVTISCTTKEFFTEKWHYTIIDAPGHRDFIKNMISGAAQADVCCLMVPADGNFTTAIQKGNHKAGEVQGQTRQHARLINLLGVKQLMVGVNKMDTDTAGPYKKERYDEVRFAASPLFASPLFPFPPLSSSPSRLPPRLRTSPPSPSTPRSAARCATCLSRSAGRRTSSASPPTARAAACRCCRSRAGWATT